MYTITRPIYSLERILLSVNGRFDSPGPRRIALRANLHGYEPFMTWPNEATYRQAHPGWKPLELNAMQASTYSSLQIHEPLYTFSSSCEHAHNVST